MNAPKLRFKEFNDGWQKKELREISQIYDGTHQTPNYIQNGVPFVSVEDISDIEKTNKFISKNAFEKEFKIKPQVNDILMTRITAGIIGATAIVKNNNPLGYYVSLALIRKNKKIDVNYLNQYINCFKFKKELNKRIIHVAFPKKINLGDIGKCKISITSINEQQKIGKMLNILDRKIELQSKKIEALKLFKKGLSTTIFNSLRDFEEYKLGKICNITTGKLDANAMIDNGKYRFYTCAKEYSLIDKYAFDTEALLISGNGACVGYIHYYKGKFNAYQRTYVLDNFSQNIQFIKCYLEENLAKRINSEKKEGNTPYIVLSTLSDMVIKIPSKENQIKISNIINCHNKKIELEENKLLKLKELKKGLMQSMFV